MYLQSEQVLDFDGRKGIFIGRPYLKLEMKTTFGSTYQRDLILCKCKSLSISLWSQQFTNTKHTLNSYLDCN